MKHYLCTFSLSLALSCQSTANSDASSHQAAEPESRTAPPTSEPSADVQDVSSMMAPEPAEPTHSPDVLSVAWVQQKSKADPAAAAKAQALELEAHRLYQSGKDADAVRLYERAALEHATASLYYRFANSLSNVDRLEDAVKAYLIADDLGYEHPELVHYNLACAYSRLEQREPAFQSLDQAIQSGYSATDKLATDPDLAFLRGLPEWKQRLALYRPEVGELVGRYVEYDYRDIQDHYLLCPGGGVVTERVGGWTIAAAAVPSTASWSSGAISSWPSGLECVATEGSMVASMSIQLRSANPTGAVARSSSAGISIPKRSSSRHRNSGLRTSPPSRPRGRSPGPTLSCSSKASPPSCANKYLPR